MVARRAPVAAVAVGAPLLLIAVFLYVQALAPTFTDDAFITFTYARALAGSLTWGFFPGRPANTATSPLNVVLTALAGGVAGSVESGAAWLAAALYTAVAAVLGLLSRRLFGGYAFAVAGFLALVANPLLVSTLGLETLLFVLLFLASLLLFTAGRWAALAVALALLTLTRAEGALLFAMCLVVLPGPRAPRLRFALLYGIALLPWHLFSWVELGSLVPDTLLIKRGQEAWAGVSFPTGLAAYYLRRFPAATAASFAMLPFAALLWGRASPAVRRVAGLTAGYAALHYAAYSALRVPPYHWYYAPMMLACAVLGALGCGAAWASGVRWRRAAAALALAVPAAGVAVLFADGLPPREAPIHSNWATRDQYRAIGLALRDLVRPEETVAVTGEIGTLAFYSERRLANYFSDRNEIAVPRSAGGARLASIPLVGPPLRGLVDGALALNARWRAPLPPLGPPAYTLRLAPGGQAAAPDPDVVRTWHTSSRWLPQGMTATLRRTPSPPR